MSLLLLLGLAGQMMPAAPVAPVAPVARDTPEERLALLVNQYRVAHGLPPVPMSPSLTRVAKAHAADMAARPDGGAAQDLGSDPSGMRCTSHSWSARGRWTPVCYTANHAHPEGMWNKPREITQGRYAGDGFEIAFWRSDAATPENAMAGWQASAAHESLIRETGAWAGAKWQAMGVGIVGHYAFVWFGKVPDREKVQLAAR